MQDYLDIFNASYERAIGNSSYNPEFIARFYDIFLAQSEEIAERFRNTDMSAQKTMLHDSLHYMVDFFVSRKTNEYLVRVARAHSKREHDIPANLYEIWLDSLVKALKEVDPEFDDNVELAWRLVLAPGISFMKFMHERS